MAATTLPNPELDGLGEGDYERIGEKVTHRLAQRPGSYVIPSTPP